MKYAIPLLSITVMVFSGIAAEHRDEHARQLYDTGEISPDARAILDRLDLAGTRHDALRADIVYRVRSPLTGDTEERTGWVAYRKSRNPDGPTTARFRACFLTLRLGKGRTMKNRIDYLFDGRWLIVAKHAIKSMAKIEIAAAGEKIESMKIGREPLPVPFGRNVDEIVPRFKAYTREPAKDDPKNTDYLKLVPREKHRDDVNFAVMAMWIDRDSGLPVKIVSADRHKSVTTAVFDNIRTGVTIKPALFTMPTPPGWELSITRKNKAGDDN